MRRSLTFLAALAGVVLLGAGCASTPQGFAFEQKFGRGLRNFTEFARGGEIRRSMEESALLDGPEVSYTAGFVHGFNKSLARTGVGVYEMITAPLPPYHPVLTDYLPDKAIYPDNYRPSRLADSTFDLDTALGFTGGDVMPFVPGSRFRIFDN